MVSKYIYETFSAFFRFLSLTKSAPEGAHGCLINELVGKLRKRGEILDGGIGHKLTEDESEVVSGFRGIIWSNGGIVKLKVFLATFFGDIGLEPAGVVVEFVDEVEGVEVLIDVVEGEEDVHGAAGIAGAGDEDAVFVIFLQSDISGEADFLVSVLLDFEIKLVELFANEIINRFYVHFMYSLSWISIILAFSALFAIYAGDFVSYKTLFLKKLTQNYDDLVL